MLHVFIHLQMVLLIALYLMNGWKVVVYGFNVTKFFIPLSILDVIISDNVIIAKISSNRITSIISIIQHASDYVEIKRLLR